MNILKKIKTVAKTVKVYKTWPLMVRSSLPGFHIDSPTVCELRSGASYNVESWSDLHVVREVWTHGHYDHFMGEIRDNASVIDIGAHIGVFSVAAALHAPGVKVFAFEPFPDNFSRLKANIARNKLNDRIIPIDRAVSGVRGTREIYDMPERFSPSLYPLKDNKGAISVQCMTLKDIFDEYKIDRCDFLKVDCEGLEYEIIAATPPEYVARIRTITLETHDHLIAETEGNKEKLIAFLHANHFDVVLAEDGTHMLYAKNTAIMN